MGLDRVVAFSFSFQFEVLLNPHWQLCIESRSYIQLNKVSFGLVDIAKFLAM